MTRKLKRHCLGLFLSQGVSLSSWEESGLLQREIEPYNLLAARFKKIYIFSYGGNSEKKYQNRLAKNIKIIPNSQKTHHSRYVYLMPFRHKRIIRLCRFLKTEQISGSKAAILGKIINPKARLIIRAGYPLSFYLKQKKHWPAFIMASLLEFFAFNLACACLVTSKQIKKDVLKKIIVKKNKVKKIANYINTEIFRPLIRIKKYDSRFICVSRLSREKNLSSLIKALKGTNFKLDLIGRGEEKNKLKRVARKAKIKVNFLGPYPNHRLASILNKYPIFILPSFYEGMPKSLLEAMSCGLACVATKTRGNIEIIEHKKTGLLCETSAQSLQKKITFLYKNKKLQKKLGRNARNFVKKNFSLYSQIKKEIKIYEKLA